MTVDNTKMRDELVAAIFDFKTAGFAGLNSWDAETLANALIAEGWVKPEPVWVESLENDGTHEFTRTSHCDGTDVTHWRRKPGKSYQADPEPWENYEPGK